MCAEKYDWQSKIREAKETAKASPNVETPDWRAKIREAMGVAESLANGKKLFDWRFRDTIGNAIEVVKAEQEAKRNREAAEKALLDKARYKAMMVRDAVIIPLLNRLRDDFAADAKKVLPEWHVQSDEQTDLFSAEAAALDFDASGATCFIIRAQASVADLGEFVNLSVVCSSVNPKSTSTSQLAPLFDKTGKFPTGQVFDELGNRKWIHKQIMECTRMCILTKMRQLPTSDVDSVPREEMAAAIG